MKEASTENKDRETLYSFKCPACGSNKAVELSRSQRFIAYLKSPERNQKDSVYCYHTDHSSVIECSQCRKRWDSLDAALQERAFSLYEVRTRQQGYWCIHQILGPHKFRRKTFPETGNAVLCGRCKWQGIVEAGATVCPRCFHQGRLHRQHDTLPDVIPFDGAYGVITETENNLHEYEQENP